MYSITATTQGVVNILYSNMCPFDLYFIMNIGNRTEIDNMTYSIKKRPFTV